ncbi:MAG: class I SAM-dependent methyltransferase [Bdellovibrionota bacterium]
MLDIGCEGANIEYQALVNKVPDVHGFTLSPEQAKKCQSAISPTQRLLATITRLISRLRKFDAIISICMMEHIVSPEDARAGKAIDLYRDY